ncbi:hypothetical protein SLEP1_g36624 [Rubroshorea leprosula]|uniref:Uncharacterized protein n=1 Tax=Rubroshorea leprosula TaxID=152421 RepID=A0AAV5KS79_9ROSI|nr:hypothetical protein SLEP1_g36624 [Rubroshorea leprosula]
MDAELEGFTLFASFHRLLPLFVPTSPLLAKKHGQLFEAQELGFDGALFSNDPCDLVVTANPLMAPIMGLGHRSIWATMLDSRSFTSPLNTSSTAVRSTPEQNARPNPGLRPVDGDRRDSVRFPGHEISFSIED